ncbi:FtsK/SpoIIIE domain-containing protein [Herbidospora sp. NBRC 101105]|uniref:FtsK/SpoIIIE domain-containing protein n=1 Tax=Herbidospora sp. NBRC 101105 TaxID=3032195 RepID=UPI0024A3DB69|nr:FtsK/SpoIIIE domain-containing protein [Herbidospora sp. NBRC 101105]GLX95578.1 cell division protein FtsK [Herbidospora sp. NBRC 101105]
MRITLTVVGGAGHRDVIVDGDESTTATGLAAALDTRTLGNVVRLPRARAPYGIDREAVHDAAAHDGVLWLDGRPLPADARVFGLLRDGDRVALDPAGAAATVVEEPGGTAELRVAGGPGAGSVHRLGLGAHVIGRDPACAVAVADPLLPPEAAVVRLGPAAITVEPVGTVPLRLAGEPVTGPVDWPENAVLGIGHSVFTVGRVEPPDAHLDALPDGGLAYNRPPRLVPPERVAKIEVPQEPRRPEGARLQLLAAFLPAAFGLVMAWAFQNWYFLLIAFMTPMIMIGQWASDRRHGRKQHRQAVKDHKAAMEAFDRAVEKARAADEAARRAAAPDPAELLLTATGPRRRLWERRTHDADALRLRVGLADLPAEITFDPPAPELVPPARDVPVALAMRRLGVAGVTGPRPGALAVARWLVAQAATLHSPRDLAIVVLSANPDGASQWGWVRWLPHCVTHATGSLASIGGDPESAARRVAELAALITERQGDEGGPLLKPGRLTGGPSSWNDLGRGAPKQAEPSFGTYDERPYDVLVVLDGAQAMRALPGMPQVLRQGPPAGVYTIALDEAQSLLPEECATVVACEDDGTIRLRGGGLDALGTIRPDQVSPAWADRLARSLAPLRDVSRDDPSAALPDSARLLDLIDVPDNPGRSTRAVLGVGPDGPFSVDLRRDGPHALIAGTTGAGKSELLQTLISSLAAVNRPDEMTFVLVDYKGGAAFKECVRLPHTVGMVSDLDAHLTQRALASLAAEIRRRERLLLEAGAKDIDDYLDERGTTWIMGATGVRQATAPGIFGRAAVRTTGVREPMPRLVLIIDEFAALVAELPEFVEGLVDIARRGRSLGIHLILATQRPAGVVTADIQANTSLRIALRVTDARESADVIDGPEAAHIPKSTPGRCYVRSGAGPAVAVQAARIGGRAPGGGGSPGQVRVTDLPWEALGRPPASTLVSELAGTTDLARLVDRVIEVSRGVPKQPSPWLPPLTDQVALPEVDGETIAFGVTDLPWAQQRRPLVLGPGHLLIAGTARSGRSTALRTIAGSLARQVTADDLHLHAVDCGSGALLPLVALPHCGAVVTRDQLDRVERLLARLRAEIARRQQLLAEAGFASLAEARAAGLKEPWLLLMIDRWEGFVAAFENYDYGRLVDGVMQILREGPAVGLRAVVTSDRSGLIGQISTVFDDRLVLRLADPADYGLAGLPAKNVPSSMPNGRALSMSEHGIVESQIALLADDPSGPAQVAALQSLARTAAPATVNRPLRVDALPARITADQALGLVRGFRPPSRLWALLGAGGDALAPMGVDLLGQGPAAVIAGPSRSGRSSTLLTAAQSLLDRDVPVLVIAPRRSPLRELRGVLAVLDGNARSVREDDQAAAGGGFGGLPGAHDPMKLLEGQENYVVIVDDAELISPDSALGTALDEILRKARDGDHGLLIAGTTGDLATAYRGFVAEARKARTGLLLSVQSPADGDLFNVRLPRGATGGGPVGRGLLIVSGTATPIQTAVP